ncbi:MAG TPA: DUF4383 domain-containing protein [Jatrophihabitans sp.]|nr:DUF4383 domain-containing protein [Jatrophihabitans sp.]
MKSFSRTPASLFALAFGLIYLIVGILGFAITGLHGFASMDGPRVFGLFMVNPLHNVVHLLLAAIWLAGAPRAGTAKLANLVIGGLLGLVTVLGFAHVLTFLGIHSLGDPDNFLHLATATLALYFGSIGADALVLQPEEQLA